MCSAWNTVTNEKVVLKKIRLSNVNLKARLLLLVLLWARLTGRAQYVLEEVINHKSSAHSAIVAFLDCYFVLEDQELWVALEFMAGGNLTRRIGPTVDFPEAEMSRVLRSVADGALLCAVVVRRCCLTRVCSAAADP